MVSEQESGRNTRAPHYGLVLCRANPWSDWCRKGKRYRGNPEEDRTYRPEDGTVVCDACLNDGHWAEREERPVVS